MSIEVGKKYMLRNGTKVTVMSENKEADTYAFKGEDAEKYKYSWNKYGTYNVASTEGHRFDIVEELSHPTLSFKEGHQYKLRNGKIVTITKIHEDPEYIYVIDGIDDNENVFSWTKEGFIDNVAGGRSPWDIVEEYFVEDEEVSEQTLIIEVGKKYLLKNGEAVLIDDINEDKDDRYPVKGTDEDGLNLSWTLDGKYDIEGGAVQFDILKEYHEYTEIQVGDIWRMIDDTEVRIIVYIEEDERFVGLATKDEEEYFGRWTKEGHDNKLNIRTEYSLVELEKRDPEYQFSKLEVGKIYKTKNDRRVLITDVDYDYVCTGDSPFTGRDVYTDEEFIYDKFGKTYDSTMNIVLEEECPVKHDTEEEMTPKNDLPNITLKVGGVYETDGGFTTVLIDKEGDVWIGLDNEGDTYRYNEYGKTLDFTMNLVKELSPITGYLADMIEPKVEMPSLSEILEDPIHQLMGIDLHRHLLQDLHDTYVAKNKDYGNSFEKSLDEFGLIASIVRVSDKLERLKSLKDKDKGEVDESLVDTCLDAANYLIMTAMWLKKQKT